jgi:tRNA 2-thiouridine synthesizing protein A
LDVDARGLKCPLPIVRLTKAVKQSTMGDKIRIQADDKAFEPDVRAWCRKTGNALVSLTVERGVTAAVIRKEN